MPTVVDLRMQPRLFSGAALTEASGLNSRFSPH